MFWQLLPCFGNFEQFLPCFGSRGNFWQIRITGKGLAWKQLGTQCSVGVMPRWDEPLGQVPALEIARAGCTAFGVHLRRSMIRMPWIWATMEWIVHFSTQPTAGLLRIGRFQSKLPDFLQAYLSFTPKTRQCIGRISCFVVRHIRWGSSCHLK